MHTSGYQKWRKWAELFQEVVALPADPKYVALYLTDVLNSALTSSKCVLFNLVGTSNDRIGRSYTTRSSKK